MSFHRTLYNRQLYNQLLNCIISLYICTPKSYICTRYLTHCVIKHSIKLPPGQRAHHDVLVFQEDPRLKIPVQMRRRVSLDPADLGPLPVSLLCIVCPKDKSLGRKQRRKYGSVAPKRDVMIWLVYSLIHGWMWIWRLGVIIRCIL